MNKLTINFYCCGMNNKNFAKNIMIYKPHSTLKRKFNILKLKNNNITCLSDLISILKQDKEIIDFLGEWSLANLTVSTCYIRYKQFLITPVNDKKIDEIFKDINSHHLKLCHFCVGGASIHNEMCYRFTVHPNEKNHLNMPHVHVSKSGTEIRYSLETLQPIDTLINPHKKDNKKTIIPFLKKNQKRLLNLWNMYMKGYSSPEITENNKQFYPES